MSFLDRLRYAFDPRKLITSEAEKIEVEPAFPSRGERLMWMENADPVQLEAVNKLETLLMQAQPERQQEHREMVMNYQRANPELDNVQLLAQYLQESSARGKSYDPDQAEANKTEYFRGLISGQVLGRNDVVTALKELMQENSKSRSERMLRDLESGVPSDVVRCYFEGQSDAYNAQIDQLQELKNRDMISVALPTREEVRITFLGTPDYVRTERELAESESESLGWEPDQVASAQAEAKPDFGHLTDKIQQIVAASRAERAVEKAVEIAQTQASLSVPKTASVERETAKQVALETPAVDRSFGLSL